MQAFYKNYDIYKAMAAALNTNVDFIVAQSALETGYGSSSAFRNKKNLFGASDASETPLRYASYQASADAWSKRWGDDVSGDKTAAEYFQDLVDDGYNPHPGYVQKLVSQVSDTQKWTAICVPAGKR